MALFEEESKCVGSNLAVDFCHLNGIWGDKAFFLTAFLQGSFKNVLRKNTFSDNDKLLKNNFDCGGNLTAGNRFLLFVSFLGLTKGESLCA